MFSAVSGGVHAKGLSYPDTWQVYMSERTGHPAVLFYNTGIAEVLDRLSDRTLVTLTLPLIESRPDGLPTPAESDRLRRLDDLVDWIVLDRRADYLGRVTTEAQRCIYLLTDPEEASLGEALVKAAKDAGYRASYGVEPGAGVRVYTDVLMPSPDEQRRIGDQSVLTQLTENGDIATKARRVDHWAYFPTATAASAFATWAKEAGFHDVTMSAGGPAPMPFEVKSAHDGTMVPEEIFARTLSLDQHARAVGGHYDGWETSVMR